MDVKNLNMINRLFRLIRNNPIWLEKGYCIKNIGSRNFLVYCTLGNNRMKKIGMISRKKQRFATFKRHRPNLKKIRLLKIFKNITFFV